MIQEIIARYQKEKLLEHIALRVGNREGVALEYFSDGVNERTFFDVASVTKIFCTTTLFLIALDQKKVGLTDTLSNYFDCPADKAGITLYQLLTHSAGLGGRDWASYKGEGADFILRASLAYSSGEKVQYNCEGFVLLGMILEKVYGMPLEKAFEIFVKTPLGVRETCFNIGAVENIVDANEGFSAPGTTSNPIPRALGGVAGNAGLFSNLHELTALIKLIQNHGAPLFGEETFALAAQNHTAHLNESRGLGFYYVDRRDEMMSPFFADGAIGHRGHTGQAVFCHPESGRYAVILTDATKCAHAQGHRDSRAVHALHRELHQVIKEQLL